MMNFHVRGFNPEKDCLDEAVTSVDVWYDRHTRLWIVQKLNKDGDQIGDAIFTAHKNEAMQEAKEIKENIRRAS